MADEFSGEAARDALRRARWRLRGAWMGPTFAVLTLVETVTLSQLPLAGDDTGFVGALLISVFLQLVAVSVLAPLGGAALRRARPDLPKEVARDRSGTFWLLALFCLLLAIGVVNASN